MTEYGKKASNANLASLGLGNAANVYWNMSPAELVEKTLERGEGMLTDTGALAVDTGEFTGRSPKDKFMVKDEITKDTIWWGDVNIPFDAAKFDKLYDRVTAYLGGKDIFIRDSYACADPRHRLNIRVVTETPWSNLFSNNLFLRPAAAEIENFQPEWHILCAPGFRADAATDGTRQHNFAILNLTRKIILIGGTGYTGEIKKGIFTLLNYILPQERGVLSMHCSANIGKKGDTAIFFGLSGTGKTTLSADPERGLIGDDEHGWTDDSVFNFEGGCYAKCIDLTKEKEPQIWEAIKAGALVENIHFLPGTKTVDYTNTKKTENTRVAYPIDHISNAVEPSVGAPPKNIFFLTADAFGVLPPISKLTVEQAMYHFISGYTAKVAGTEVGITEPQTTFSACFGKAFLPLHPGKYAELLGKKLHAHPDINVWLVNTGWTGGAYGVGSRIKLSYTRALITAALNGELNNVEYGETPYFRLRFPKSCPGVPAEILEPRNTWTDKNAFEETAQKLAASFVKNFDQYASGVSKEVLSAAPRLKAVEA
ncbi:MAG: phosphoenolpyruvate carboxykinase (ATP) [Bacteroidetes bacterium]|nr:MAG: phosphoenolpyruvate carboxykinase (ATP) [Bacteroidota bacterium]